MRIKMEDGTRYTPKDTDEVKCEVHSVVTTWGALNHLPVNSVVALSLSLKNTETLKPCPKCGSKRLGWIDYSYVFQFECHACGHLGPKCGGHGIAEARKRWDAQIGSAIEP